MFIMVRISIFPLINTPTPEGVIISQPIFRFLGVIFDGDHDFEGPRSPSAHLDTVLRNLSSLLGRPFTLPLYVVQKSLQRFKLQYFLNKEITLSR